MNDEDRDREDYDTSGREERDEDEYERQSHLNNLERVCVLHYLMIATT